MARGRYPLVAGLYGMKASRTLPEEEIQIMDIRNDIGEMAGRVWQALSSDGPQTAAELRKKLKCTGELLSFALGWLSREDKVEICQEKKGFRIQLK